MTQAQPEPAQPVPRPEPGQPARPGSGQARRPPAPTSPIASIDSVAPKISIATSPHRKQDALDFTSPWSGPPGRPSPAETAAATVATGFGLVKTGAYGPIGGCLRC